MSEDKDTNALAEQRSVNSSSPQSLLQKETVPAQESDISMQGQFDFLQQHCAVISKMATKAQEAMQEIQSLKLIMLSQTTPAASKRSGTSMCPNISPPRKKSKEDRAVNDIFQAGEVGRTLFQRKYISPRKKVLLGAFKWEISTVIFASLFLRKHYSIALL